MSLKDEDIYIKAAADPNGNTFYGSGAGANNIASNNTFFGSDAGGAITTGINNTFVGRDAGIAITTGVNNTIVGAENSSTAAVNNATLIGFQASASGSAAVAIGFNSTAASGSAALSSSSSATGANSLAIGDTAKATGLQTLAIGYKSTSSGPGSLALGRSALAGGSQGVALGFSANASGADAIALGHQTAGSQPQAVALGRLAIANGAQSLVLGYQATGSQAEVVAIGKGAQASGKNSSALGNQAVVLANNTIQIGNTSVTNVIFGDGTTTTLTAAAIPSVSDKRIKKDIAEDIPGIEFIKKLKPISYRIDGKVLADFSPNCSNDYKKYSDKKSGFIAQEVEEAADAIGYDFDAIYVPESDEDLYSLSYSNFVVPLVQAAKEQQQIIEILERKVMDMELENKKILDILYNCDIMSIKRIQKE